MRSGSASTGISSITYGYGRRSVVAQSAQPGAGRRSEDRACELSSASLRVAAAGALVALAVAAPAGAATVKLSGGSTTLKLDPGTAKALKGLGVSVTPIAPAKAGAKGVSFPITGGTINPATAAGTITHSGGLQLRAGATKVRLTRFTIGVDRTPTISVKAGKARLHAFTLGGRGEDQPRRAGHQRLRRRRQAERQGRGRPQRGLRREGLQARPARRHGHGEGRPRRRWPSAAEPPRSRSTPAPLRR